MHKGIILLVKADNKENAIDSVNEFMESYGDGEVWDWFVIGGRWSNTLAPKQPRQKWAERAKELLPKNEHGFISTKDVENVASELQEAWESEGLRGKNFYYDNYKLPSSGDYYDIVPLSECIDTVKEWIKDINKETEEIFAKMVKAREVEKEKGNIRSGMSGYYAREYADLHYGNFCFESNVYDITESEAESIPDDITGYMAVMVDIHN